MYREIPTRTIEARTRFWAKIDKRSPDDCWPWTGCRRDGYGLFLLGRTTYSAHRIAFLESTGIQPQHLCVCHTCDMPLCCNPKHLFLGTNADNMRDRNKKGRQAKGEKLHTARLTEENVIKISQAQKAYFHGQDVALAGEYGVASNAIRAIRTGEHWAHLESVKAVSSMRVSKPQLTEQQVVKIKNDLKTFRRGQGKILAEKYNTTLKAIYRIRQGVTWSHIHV